jgi:hypothetical protein
MAIEKREPQASARKIKKEKIHARSYSTQIESEWKIDVRYPASSGGAGLSPD